MTLRIYEVIRNASVIFTVTGLVTAMHSADVRGRVTIQSNQPLQGAVVLLARDAGKQKTITLTDSKGRYRMKDVTPDKYALEISKDGQVVYQAIISVGSEGMLKDVVLSVKDSSQPLRAVSLDRRAKSGVYVLEEDGAISYIAGNLDTQNRRLVGSIGPSPTPGNLVSMESDGKQFIFVTSTTDEGGHGLLEQFRADDKKLIHYWITPTFCSGIDIDPSTKTLYLSSATRAEAYEMRLQEKKLVAPLFQISGAPAFVDIAIDTKRKQLFFADTSGRVLVSSSPGKLPSETFRVNGTPVGMVFDPESDAVYVAVHSGEIYRTEIGGSHPTPVLFARNRNLKELSGLSIRPDGVLLVTAYHINSIFILDKDGHFQGIDP